MVRKLVLSDEAGHPLTTEPVVGIGEELTPAGFEGWSCSRT